MADTTLSQALLAFQAEAPALQKDRINPAFKSKYLSLDSLMGQVLPLLNKHGLAWVTMPVTREEGASLRYRLIHAESGQEIDGEITLPVDKQNAQGLGSAITYMRRYTMLAVLGLVADDDDGAKASRPRQQANGQAADTNRLLKPEELTRMIEAVDESGQKLELVLAAVGLDATDDVTLEHAKAIKAMIA